MIRHWLHSIKHRFRHKAIVLMYHRIADISSDPWQLAVSPAHFEEQLQVLKRYRVISMRELVEHVRNNSIPSNCVCLSFDDGYGDNYHAAIPLLEKYEIPASIFIATGYINQQRPFWWDELEQLLLHSSELPSSFSTDINGQPIEFDLGKTVLSPDEEEQQHHWQWPAPPPTQRIGLYLTIWEQLKPLTYPSLQPVLQNIQYWAGNHVPANDNDFPMTEEQLNISSRHPLVDIGLHTTTHTALGAHSAETQRYEMEACRQYLETHTAQYQPLVTYPYGSYNHETLELARDMQLSAGFTTEEQVVTQQSHLYRLGRFQVKNWNGEIFEKQLTTWMKQG